MAGKWIEKRYIIEVTKAGDPYSKKFDLDKNTRLVRGILVSSDNPKLVFFRGSQRIEISGDEIFPEDFESKILMSGLGVPPDQKYRSLGDGVIAGNGEVKVLYKDVENPNAPFTPYYVSFIFQCELK
jgi:hypothetical protein